MGRLHSTAIRHVATILNMSQPDIEGLFDRTLEGAYEDDAPWEAVHELRRIGSQKVFDLAKEWCGSTDPLHRARGLDVLAQLGRTAEHPQNSFLEESEAVVKALISRENDALPLASAIDVLGHLDKPSNVPLIARFHTHPDQNVRFSVACALGSFSDEPLSATTLLRLMRDQDKDVRDWATFGLGVLGNQDSPEIRDALIHALRDTDEDVREEALVGLAKRHDLEALPHLLRLLQQDNGTVRGREAASLLLGYEQEPKGWTNDEFTIALKQQFPAPQDK
jgi:HEAT repeats